MCSTGDNSFSVGDFGSGSGGGFLAAGINSLYKEVVELPGSAESHKGTKLAFDEDRLRLI